jgi:hypothetical protein
VIDRNISDKKVVLVFIDPGLLRLTTGVLGKWAHLRRERP